MRRTIGPRGGDRSWRTADLPKRLGLTPAQAVTVALCACVVVGAALRFVALGSQSFGHDEAVTVGRVLRPGLGATLREVGRSERTPYLYYVGAWLWTRVFGVGAVGIRSLSALFGTLTIPVAFAAGRVSVSERTGVVAAGLVALDPFLVYYSQEARSYALLALLAACSLWAFANALRSPTRPALAAWGAISAVAIATHYFAVFLIAGEAAWLIVAVGARRQVLLVSLMPIGVTAALLALVAEQVGLQGGGVDQTSALRAVPTAFVQFLFGERLSIRGLYTLTPLLGTAACLGAIALCSNAWRGRWRKLSAVGSVGVGALLLPFAAELVGLHFFNARNSIGCLIALIILVAGCLCQQPIGRCLALTAALAGAGLALSVALALDPSLQRPDYRQAAAQLGGSVAGRRALVISPGGDIPVELYRARHDPEPWPSSARIGEIDILGANDASPGAAAPAGFQIVGERDSATVRVTRLIAATPQTVTRATLLRLAPTGGRPTLLLEHRG